MGQPTEAEGTFEQSHDQTQTTTLTYSAKWNLETHIPETLASHTTGYTCRFQFPEPRGITDLPRRRFGIAPRVLYQLPENLGVCNLSHIADKGGRATTHATCLSGTHIPAGD